LGISGIPPVRDTTIIRPLIQTNRSEIIKFLDIKGIPWVKDASNNDRQFLRNRIRLDLIPLLKKSYNPEIIDSLNRMASVLRCEEDWIESITTQMYNQCLISENILCENSQSVVFSVQKFCMMHIAAKRRILRKAVLQIKGDLKRIQLSHIDDAIDLSNRQESTVIKGIDLPDGIRVELNHFHLTVLKKTNDKKSAGSKITAGKTSITDDPVFTYQIKKPGTLFIREINALLKISLYPRHCLPNFPDVKNFAGIKNTEAYFDMDLISFPVIIRTPVAGDRFIPLGITGVQKLKKFFIDHKVPKSERKLCPVLVSENSILWIAGHRMADPFKISPSTETVLKAELLLA
ncbi:tRNA lysidine(34) synthetase TilS, partial [Desulfobacterales bacterium HSG16]|nr:tRNA lysidine(34) synthetase TilS [Desulfobacterales bacterium HSG16]